MLPDLFTSACASFVLFCMSTLASTQDHRERVPPAQPLHPVQAPYDLTATRIDWVEGIDHALGRGKPILLFQLLGRFDEQFC
jgi:hypothetical protein